MRSWITGAVLFSVCGFMAQAACGGPRQSEGAASTKGQHMLDRVSFAADFSVSPTRIGVRFVIDNNRDDEIYVVDRAFQVDASGPTVRQDSLVVGYGEHGLGVLSSVLVLPDPSMTFATPPVFYATRVTPGVRYSGEAGAPLPLRPEGWRTPRTPEGAELAGAAREGRCTRLRFELGVIPGTPGTVRQPVEIAGVMVVQLDMQTARSQEVLFVERSGMSVPCLSLVR